MAMFAALEEFAREHMTSILIWVAIAVLVWKMDFKPRRGR